jgi:hypothetical protein
MARIVRHKGPENKLAVSVGSEALAGLRIILEAIK